MKMEVRNGSVIQINEQIPEWTGCLMIVEEVKDWGVLAGLKVPQNGTAYLRVKHEQYEYIGEAVLVPMTGDEEE